VIAVSGAIVFAGYQLAAYGWSQLQGQNAGFFDLLWPGRYKGNTPDKGSSTSSSTSGTVKSPTKTINGLQVSPPPGSANGYGQILGTSVTP